MNEMRFCINDVFQCQSIVLVTITGGSGIKSQAPVAPAGVFTNRNLPQKYDKERV